MDTYKIYLTGNILRGGEDTLRFLKHLVENKNQKKGLPVPVGLPAVCFVQSELSPETIDGGCALHSIHHFG